MTTSGSTLLQLKRDRPEWAPWMAVVEEVLKATNGPAWEAAVPAGLSLRGSTAPLLAGAKVSLKTNSVRRLLERLIRVASRGGSPAMATLEAVLHADVDLLALFTASLCQDGDRLKGAAAASGADADALEAVVALLPVPFLHACNRRWASSISGSGVERYCPVCGSWPAFAEVRGIERIRQFRCARCGGAWHAEALYCPYCATRDHHELVALVPESGDSRAVIEACRRCHGYVKTLTRLQGCSPDTVMLEDLASADLDVAALEQGFSRPAGAACRLEVAVTEEGATRRFFAWKA
jgi:FdhE protein